MRPVHILFTAIFCMSIGFGIMTPAVSLYSVLGFGVNEWELGILGALTSLPYAIGPAIFGRYSDKVGRRPLVLAGISMYAVISLAYIAAPVIAFLALLRVMEGLCFSLIWPVSEAWVGDLSGIGERKRLIGNYSVAWSSGYMLGPFLLGFVVTYSNVAYSFALAALLVLVSIPLVMRVRDHSHGDMAPEAMGGSGGGLITLAVLFSMVLWGTSQLAYFFLLPSYTLGVGFPAAYASYLIGTVALLRTIVFLAYPRLVERLKGWMLAVGALLLAAAMFSTWVARDLTQFAVASCILGVAFGMIYAYSLNHVLDRPAKGMYAGFFESAIGIGQIAGPLSMGYIGFVISPSSPYLAMGLLSIVSAIAISGALLISMRRAP